MNIFFPVKCKPKGHKAKIVIVDFSKAYDKKEPYYHIKCADGGCCFGEYYLSKSDAILDWNKEHLK